MSRAPCGGPCRLRATARTLCLLRTVCATHTWYQADQAVCLRPRSPEAVHCMQVSDAPSMQICTHCKQVAAHGSTEVRQTCRCTSWSAAVRLSSSSPSRCVSALSVSGAASEGSSPSSGCALLSFCLFLFCRRFICFCASASVRSLQEQRDLSGIWPTYVSCMQDHLLPCKGASKQFVRLPRDLQQQT